MYSRGVLPVLSVFVAVMVSIPVPVFALDFDGLFGPRYLSLTPTDDTTIDTRLPWPNEEIHGQDYYLVVGDREGAGPWGNDAGDQRFVYLKFNLDQLPEGAIITHAVLKLKIDPDIDHGSALVRARRLVTEWDEDSATAESASFAAWVEENITTTVRDGLRGNHFYEWDLTQMVDRWRSDANNGVALYAETSSTEDSENVEFPFESKESLSSPNPITGEQGGGTAPHLNIWYRNRPWFNSILSFRRTKRTINAKTLKLFTNPSPSPAATSQPPPANGSIQTVVPTVTATSAINNPKGNTATATPTPTPTVRSIKAKSTPTPTPKGYQPKK